MLEPFKDKEGIILLLVVTIVAGAVYWSVPYGEVNFFGTQFLITWGIIAIVGGFLGGTISKKIYPSFGGHSQHRISTCGIDENHRRRNSRSYITQFIPV